MGKVYLSNTPRREALEKFLAKVSMPRRMETVPVAEALGRVTAVPVLARLSMPGYHAAAMDGIAVVAESTFNASDQNPLPLEPGREFVNVNTGNPLPPGFDAVIKIEDLQILSDGRAELLAPATPWQHVRAVGEDVVAGDLVVSAWHALKPADLGAILAGGITEIKVLVKPQVAIIPSGSDLVEPGQVRRRGDVPDYNSTVIAAYLRQWGAEPLIRPIVPDDPVKIKAAVLTASATADLVMIIAGSSAGEKDYSYQVISELGEVFLHGIASKPGKPTILGQIEGKPVIGLPGYPVSAYLSLEWFVQPLLSCYYNQPVPERVKLPVTLGRRVVSEMGIEEHVRMTVGFVDGRYIANPLPRGAGVTMSLVRADGLLIIPGNSLGYEQDETVTIELYKPEGELRHNLLVAGSHDLVIDLLASALKKEDARLNLSSAHLGSMGGIMAIGRGQAHLAGVHLFDPETGDYNLPYIKKMLPGQQLRLINLVYRMQGWIVPAGNPEGFSSISNLVDTEKGFINRQKGAGTRLLFDHLLQEAGLSALRIKGYEREEHTHLNVAAAVAAGTASVGLGILPAARAFNLDFIPLVEERYDLLLSFSFLKTPEAALLLKIICDPQFQGEVEALGGYSMREAGTIIET